MNLDFLFNAPLWLLALFALALLLLLVYVLRSAIQPVDGAAVDPTFPLGVSLRGVSREVARQQYPLRRSLVRLGRDHKANEIVLPFDTVSGRHASIEYRDGSFYLRDLRSRNGTWINGGLFSSRAEEREVPLSDGDRFRLDVYEFQFCADFMNGTVNEALTALDRTIVVPREPSPSGAPVPVEPGPPGNTPAP